MTSEEGPGEALLFDCEGRAWTTSSAASRSIGCAPRWRSRTEATAWSSPRPSATGHSPRWAWTGSRAQRSPSPAAWPSPTRGSAPWARACLRHATARRRRSRRRASARRRWPTTSACACATGIPDGSRDIVVEKGFLIENGIDDLGGVDFEKGCYIGQELTARVKHRGTVRKRLFRVDVDGPLPAPGAPVMFGAKQAGEMRSGSSDGLGLALLRLELVDQAAAAGAPLTAGDARLTPVKPAWARY